MPRPRSRERNDQRDFDLLGLLRGNAGRRRGCGNAERRDQAAGTLSGGEQQMLAIGRGIASSPRLLMLDEPSMGLAPMVADLIFERIADLHRDGLAILLVEQRVAEAVQSCDFGYVLETGRVVISGSHQTLLGDERIRSVYLGM